MYSKKHHWKGITLGVALLLLACLALGGTLAYLTDTDAPVENTFLPAKVTTSVVENTENGVKSNVKIQNTGNIPAYIRAAVAVTWQDSSGNLCGKAPMAGEDYTITWTLAGWERSSDGFYYYQSPVLPGETTDVLFTACSPVSDRAPEGYDLTVEIMGSGIQSVPETVITEHWDSGVSGVASDGTLSVKGGQGA